jgi:hypothetical protein
MRNIIALRNGFIDAPASAFKTKRVAGAQLAYSVQAELMNVGYMLDQKGIETLSVSTATDVKKFHTDVISHIKHMLGDDKKYRPFYVNFPDDVLKMDALDLYVNAVLHYWSLGTWEPAQELKDRGVAFESINFKILTTVSGDEWLHKIGDELSSFSKPLDDARVSDLVWICKNTSYKPKNISVRETLCRLAAEGVNVKITSPTDVLRIAHHLSGGDIALGGIPKTTKKLTRVSRTMWNPVLDRALIETKNDELKSERDSFKFKKFTRAERKQLLGLLESLNNIDVSEMARYLGRWIRLGEILHPGEYAAKFPRTFTAFQRLRNQDTNKVRTYAGRVDIAFKSSVEAGLQVLVERPGEFARRLDYLLRSYDQALVLDTFAQVIDKVSSKVIFELFDHFESRRVKSPRMVMIKGRGASSKVLEDLPALHPKTVDRAQEMVLASLKNRMKALPALGNVYIDEALRDAPVPYSMQSSSEGLTTLVRGTRTPFKDDAHTLRGFVHWFDEHGHLDLDLAAGFYDANLNLIQEIAYYNLYSGANYANYTRADWNRVSSNPEVTDPNTGAVHSGDIRHRVGSCAEYVDVPIAKTIKAGARYVIYTVYNFNGHSFESVPECTFGVMERTSPGSNEIFEPRTISTAIKLKAKGNSVLPVAFDLEKKQWIWMDMEHDGRGCPNLAHDVSSKKKLQAMLGSVKLSVYDLLKMHVEARGGDLVSSKKKADVSFEAADFRTDYTKLTPYMSI